MAWEAGLKIQKFFKIFLWGFLVEESRVFVSEEKREEKRGRSVVVEPIGKKK